MMIATMILTTPAALWLLLLLPVIALAYFIKKSVRNKRVPNLFLWEEASAKTFSPSWSFGIRNVFAMLIALLIAILLTGSIIKPRTKTTAGETSVVVIIDNSASMNAVHNGQSRLTRGLNMLKEIVSNKEDTTKILMMTAGGTPEIVSGFTDHYGVLRENISKIKRTERSCQMKQALDLAAGFASCDASKTNVFIITDGCFDDADHLINQNRDAHRKWFIVGEPQNNIAITRFQSRRAETGTNSFETLINVVNNGKQEVECEHELELDDAVVDIIPLKLAGGQVYESTRKYTSETGGIFYAKLSNIPRDADCLTCDNEAWNILTSQPELNILYYGDEDMFLLRVLEAQNNTNVTGIQEVPKRLADHTILVVHRQVPPILPEGKMIIVNPQNGNSQMRLGRVIDNALAEVVDGKTPLMRSIRLEGQALSGGRVCEGMGTDTLKTEVKSAETPLVFWACGDSPASSEQLVLNFSITQNNLQLRTVFPILFTNACNYLRKNTMDETYNFTMKDSIAVKVPFRKGFVQCLDSDGTELKLSGDDDTVCIETPMKPGILRAYDSNHSLMCQLAVNLESESESNLTYETVGELRQEMMKTAASSMQRPIWLMLAFCVLILLTVEWFMYHRRWTE